MIDVIALVAAPEMQVDCRPVGQLGVIHADDAAHTVQLRQRPVRREHLFVVRDRYVLVPDAKTHPLRQKIAVLLGVVYPVLIFVFDFLQQMRQVIQGWICHIPARGIMYLLDVVQTADKRQKTVVRLALK